MLKHAVWRNVTVIVMAGGKSRRMGEDKRWLAIEGQSLLEWVLAKAEQVPAKELLLSVEEASPMLRELAGCYDARLLEDREKGNGPMQGLWQGLSEMQTEYACVLSCDMPFFDFSILEEMVKETFSKTERPMAVIPVTGGHRQSWGALYHRSMAERFEKALQAGKREPWDVLEGLEQAFYELPEEHRAAFFNVNTQADLRLARGRARNLSRKMKMITISAPRSQTGKTTFIERLLPKLQESGLRVGVVKSDCNDQEIDHPGKDSYRFHEAGADAVALVSSEGYCIQQRTEGRAPLEEVAMQLQDVDLVLVESRNHGCAPWISLSRGTRTPLVTEDTAALFTDAPKEGAELREYDLDDMERAREIVFFLSAQVPQRQED